MSPRPELAALEESFRRDFAAAGDSQAVEALRVKYLGAKSELKALKGRIKDIPAEERRDFAAALNELGSSMEDSIQVLKDDIGTRETNRRIEAEWIDTSLPGTGRRRGSVHPITMIERRCLDVMAQLGFEVQDGPELETPYFNFDALNIPQHHPARDLQDTFWVEGDLVLRTHTTSIQARTLKNRPPLPIKIAAVGRVYRNEAVDATHLSMFHQLEGFWVEPGLNFAHLKGIVEFIAKGLYGPDAKLRFKPKFYPYTEPSVGIDIRCTVCAGSGCGACHEAGWVTIMGAGMIHANVFSEFGYDPQKVSGVAFGWGTTRMTSQFFGISKIKPLYEGDMRLLEQLGGRL